MGIVRLDAHMDQAGAWEFLMAQAGGLAFDIGSNVGQSTRVLARNFDRVVALEPCEESYQILAAEMPANVEALCMAASDRARTITLDVADRSISTGQLVTGEGLPIWGTRTGTRTVMATTLDVLVAEFGVPDFVKVDTEGHEVSVLEGAKGLFAEHHPAVLIEVHRAENEAPVRELLADYDLVKLTHGDYVKKGGPIHVHHFWLHS